MVYLEQTALAIITKTTAVKHNYFNLKVVFADKNCDTVQYHNIQVPHNQLVGNEGNNIATKKNRGQNENKIKLTAKYFLKK